MSIFTRKRRLAVVAALAALAAFVAVGCVGRKQYQINEAILISERRQLEDELYRLQFELRDALEENERLRTELDDDSSTPQKNEPTRGAAGVRNVRATPRIGGNSTGASTFYPGDDALQTAPTRRSVANSNAENRPTAKADGYRDSNVAPSTGGEVETLPDYVPIPLSSKTPTTSRPDSQPLGVRRDVAQRRATSIRTATAAASDAAKTNVATSNYVENAAASNRRVEPTNYQKAESTSDAVPWSPLAR